MAEVGLLNPILIQRLPPGLRCYLVAGRNRLQAAEELGWEGIDVIELPNLGTEDAATIGQLAEIAENLHRREIDGIEQAKLVAEWARLVKERQKATADKPAQVGPVSARGIVEGRGNKGGVRQTARELNMTRQSVERSLKIAKLSPEAETEARQLGLNSNQSALLEAAKQKAPEAQVATLQRRAAADKPKPSPKAKPKPSAPCDEPKPSAEPVGLRNLKGRGRRC